MSECANMGNCSFFVTYGKDQDMSLAIGGFIRIYCKGEKQERCVRKKVSETLGGPERVPANMLPNGLAMSGTSMHDWPEEAKAVRAKAIQNTKG